MANFNSMFNFAEDDLDKTFTVLYKGASLEDFGLKRGIYRACEVIDSNYHDVWNGKFYENSLELYGFRSVNHFKEAYILARIYNALKYDPEGTLRQYMIGHIDKVKLHLNYEVCKVPNKGNLVEFLMQFNVEELICIGW